MPVETQDAVNWALQQTIDDPLDGTYPVTKNTPAALVTKVREYFNAHAIEYGTFSYADLEPFLQ